MRGLILDRRKYIVSVEERRAKRRTASFVIACILFVIGCAAILIGSGKKASTGSTTQKSEPVSVVNTGEGSTPTPSSPVAVEEKKNETPEIVKANIPETYRVTKVVDGDTIYVSGIKTRIRLIGVNTPETVSSSKPVQCYGPQSSEYLTNLLLGKYVGLETDAASGDVDIYDRPLRFVYLNGENINQKLILEGYGKEYTFNNIEYKYHSQFVAAEEYASTNKKGLWSPNTCNGKE